MKWQGVALLALGLALGACDGGSSGTGISTITEGNVAAVVTAATSTSGMAPSAGSGGAPAATASLAGIRVSVAGTDFADETDASGAFRVSGDYDSVVTLLFARAADDLSARLQVNVPAGGTLGLRDVTLDAARGTAIALEQSVFFDGTITAIDCTAGELELVSRQRPDDGDVYVVVLAGSAIVDGTGRPIACAQLKDGDDATVSGAVNQDGTFGDATIVVDG